MHIVIDTKYSVGDIVKVTGDDRWKGVEFAVTAINISWSTREDSVYRQDIYGDPRNGLVEYTGMVARNTSWHFTEWQLTKGSADLGGFTWDIKEGDVILFDDTEWVVTEIKSEWEGGGWSGNMGSAIDPGTPHTFLYLEAGERTHKYELLDDKPMKVMDHKTKAFI